MLADDFGVTSDRANHDLGFFAASLPQRAGKQKLEL